MTRPITPVHARNDMPSSAVLLHAASLAGDRPAAPRRPATLLACKLPWTASRLVVLGSRTEPCSHRRSLPSSGVPSMSVVGPRRRRRVVERERERE
jgi:hypothetical protein